MKPLFLSLILVMMSACASAPTEKEATVEQFDSNCKAWIGKSSSELIEAWGMPSGEYNIDKDTKLIEFKKSNGKSAITMYGITDVVDLACTANFTIQKNIVKSYKFHGNICRARPAN